MIIGGIEAANATNGAVLRPTIETATTITTMAVAE
jgi:hypothetical protein